MRSFNRTTREGFVAGLIAYATVAVFYGVFDLLAARGPLYTVNMLGRSLFRGLRDTGVLQYPVRIDLTAVFWYNALHLVAALAIGFVVMRLVDRADRHASQAGAMLLLIVAGFVVTVLAVGWLTSAIRPVLPWWSIVITNGLAVVTTAVYVTRRRPGITRRLLSFGGRERRNTGGETRTFETD